MSMKNSNDTFGIEPTIFRLVTSTNCVSTCAPNIVRDLDYLQYTFFCPSVALSNVTKVCQETNQSSLGNKSVERITQALRFSLNTTVES